MVFIVVAGHVNHNGSNQDEHLILIRMDIDFVAVTPGNPFLGDKGHGLALFVITVAAAEAAVGLALVLALFRHKGTINVDEIRLLRG